MCLMRLILNVCSRSVCRQMSVPFLGRCERAVKRALGVSFVSATLMSGESATLSVCQLSFLELRHAAVPTRIQREGLRQIQLISHPVNDLLHTAVGEGLG